MVETCSCFLGSLVFHIMHVSLKPLCVISSLIFDNFPQHEEQKLNHGVLIIVTYIFPSELISLRVNSTGLFRTRKFLEG